jgi:Dolichyl-phosphate-mannose-protein mannosyltransferase
MPRHWQIPVLFLLLLLILGIGIQDSGLAGPFSDQLSGVHTQDETTYASGAVSLATGSGWMTPKVLGRFYLVKPPLLIWLSGLSMSVFGISRFALRFPVLVAGALATLFLFLWSERRFSRWAGVTTVLLAVSNPLWHTFSRVCYTDMLLAFAMIGALWTFDRDQNLDHSRSILLFGGFLALGLMAKNIAGMLPLAVVLVACLLSRGRPPIANLGKSCAFAALLVAPWHLYQIISHPQWFWADYVKIQLLEFGLNPPAQPSPDGPVWFYLKRFVLTDPALALLTLLALPPLVRAVRVGKREAALLLAWILVAGGALLVFQYRNLPYLLYSIPPLCMAAAIYAVPRIARRPHYAALALALVFCFKAASVSSVWGLQFGSAAPISSAKWFRWYAEQQRPNELIAVNSDDEFYATALPIAKIHYCYLDPGQLARRYAPHYAYLGITVDTAQFNNLEYWAPRFRERLLEWGLHTASPIATNIMAPSIGEIVNLVETHVHSDFYLPANIVTLLSADVLSARRVMRLSADRYFVLALDSQAPQFSAARWSIPLNW